VHFPAFLVVLAQNRLWVARRDGGEKGDFVFVTPGNCEKIADPQVAESCRSFILGI
jgi:hypothetical protein